MYMFQMRSILVTVIRVDQGHAREIPVVSRASARTTSHTMTYATQVNLV